jgi:hypothetical protein
VRLYHETARENVASILRDGFHDGGGDPSGVSVADEPPGFRSDWALLAIEAELSGEELDRFAYNKHQWPPNGNRYREWRVPAKRLNEFPRPKVINRP